MAEQPMREIPGLLEWVADGGDAGALGDGQQRAGNAGEDVGVLVGVDVGDGEVGSLGFWICARVFAGSFADFAAEDGQEEIGERGRKVCRRGRGVWGCFWGRRRGCRR